jgi:hypothetical protein
MAKNILLAVILVIAVALVSGCLGQGVQYCDEEDVAAVYECEDGSVQVVSNLPGAGYKVYRLDTSSFTCPVVAQEYKSDVCKDFEKYGSCSENSVCP